MNSQAQVLKKIPCFVDLLSVYTTVIVDNSCILYVHMNSTQKPHLIFEADVH